MSTIANLVRVAAVGVSVVLTVHVVERVAYELYLLEHARMVSALPPVAEPPLVPPQRDFVPAVTPAPGALFRPDWSPPSSESERTVLP